MVIQLPFDVFDTIPVTKIPETKLAYCAGFFDGEGYISIARIRAIFNLRVGIDLVKGEDVLEKFQKLFGGTSRSEKEGYSLRWTAHGNEAANFLKLVLPYLCIKKDEAQVALEFHSKYRELSPRHGRGHCLPAIALELGKCYKLKLSEFHAHSAGGRPRKRRELSLF